MADVMTICAKLTPEQRAAILDKFFEHNPAWRGAHVEDVIDALTNGDSNLSEVEELWERFPQLRQRGFGMAVRALIWSGSDVTEASLAALLK